MRLIDIEKLNSAIGKNVANALVGLHAFTGCDTVSAFSGKGKVNPFKLLSKNERYVDTFSDIGAQLNLREETFLAVEEFTCQMYARGTKIRRVNKLRYDIFRSKKGKIDSAQLPPCENSLRLQELIIKLSFGVNVLNNIPQILPLLSMDGQKKKAFFQFCGPPSSLPHKLSCSNLHVVVERSVSRLHVLV